MLRQLAWLVVAAGVVVEEDRGRQRLMSDALVRRLLDDKPVKLSVELPAAVHRDLVAYADALAAETGGDAVAPVEAVRLRRTHAELADADPVVAAEAVRARLRVGATNDGNVVVPADTQRTQAANKKDALERLAAEQSKTPLQKHQIHPNTGKPVKNKK